MGPWGEGDLIALISLVKDSVFIFGLKQTTDIGSFLVDSIYSFSRDV